MLDKIMFDKIDFHSKIIEFNDYFEFNHENRGKKLKNFGI